MPVIFVQPLMFTMENNYKLTKISWLIFAGLLLAVPLYSQTIVEVMADQPEKFEIIVSEDLYYETDSSFVFGQDVSVTGGEGPYLYSWFSDDQLIANSQLLEILFPVDKENYTLVVSDANNCSAVFIVDHGLTLSSATIDEIHSLVSIYPVPASRYITIDPHDITGILSVTIYGSYGSVLLNRSISGKVDLEINFPPGIYFIRLESVDGQVSGLRKIIVL